MFAARYESFTKAAVELELSQPTVSELVRKLENECHLDLFVRGGRKLVLTAAGKELLPWARRAVDSVAGGEHVVRSLRGLAGGTASFGVLRNAEYYFLSNLAEEFHRRYPNVRVRLVGQNSVSVSEAVRDGELEAGLVVLPIPDKGLEVTPLLRDEVVWVTTDAERAASPIALEKVSKRPLILYDAQYGIQDPTRRQLSQRAQAAGIRLEPTIEVENISTALSLVSRGLGETMAARAVCDSPSFPDNLHIASFTEPLFDVIALVRRQNSVPSPSTDALINVATRMMRSSGQGEILGDTGMP